MPWFKKTIVGVRKFLWFNRILRGNGGSEALHLLVPPVALRFEAWENNMISRDLVKTSKDFLCLREENKTFWDIYLVRDHIYLLHGFIFRDIPNQVDAPPASWTISSVLHSSASPSFHTKRNMSKFVSNFKIMHGSEYIGKEDGTGNSNEILLHRRGRGTFILPNCFNSNLITLAFGVLHLDSTSRVTRSNFDFLPPFSLNPYLIFPVLGTGCRDYALKRSQ